jgi:hypothetical protein
MQCFAQPALEKDSIFKTTIIATTAKKTSSEDIISTSLKVYPNPAKNKVSLQVKGFEPGMATVKITDTKGKVWREDNRLLTNGNEEIAMFLLLRPGVYFIAVSEKRKIVKKKLLVL